jgi:hypothetical protein
MAGAGTQFAARFNREWLAHSIRTTIAAMSSHVSEECNATLATQLGKTPAAPNTRARWILPRRASALPSWSCGVALSCWRGSPVFFLHYAPPP